MHIFSPSWVHILTRSLVDLGMTYHTLYTEEHTHTVTEKRLIIFLNFSAVRSVSSCQTFSDANKERPEVKVERRADRK